MKRVNDATYFNICLNTTQSILALLNAKDDIIDTPLIEEAYNLINKCERANRYLNGMISNPPKLDKDIVQDDFLEILSIYSKFLLDNKGINVLKAKQTLEKVLNKEKVPIEQINEIKGIFMNLGDFSRKYITKHNANP